MTAHPHNRQGLALVGTRGSGKTTVGQILAERLVRPFLDADVELEGKLGRSIAALFAEEGEPAFRDWEERVLHELTTGHPEAILATGGGVVLREANRKALRSFGFVVWLRADPGTASARLRADRRGLSRRPAPSTSSPTCSRPGRPCIKPWPTRSSIPTDGAPTRWPTPSSGSGPPQA